MTLELNLVFSQSIYANAFTLISRSRVETENEDQVLSAISSFIKNNIDSFDAAIADKDLVNRLQNVEINTIGELYSLKYLIASFGLDIRFNYVAELEVNPTDIGEGMIEYNVIDELDDQPSFVRSASKVVVSSESGELHTVYSKIVEGFGFFDSDLTAGFNNPLMKDLAILKQAEEVMGVSPIPVTMEINSILDYLGKKVIAITK